MKVQIAEWGATGRPLAVTPGKTATGPTEVLWLNEIVETPFGYLGVVCLAPEVLPKVRVGDAVAFDRSQILDSKHCDLEKCDDYSTCRVSSEPGEYAIT